MDIRANRKARTRMKYVMMKPPGISSESVGTEWRGPVPEAERRDRLRDRSRGMVGWIAKECDAGGMEDQTERVLLSDLHSLAIAVTILFTNN